MPRKTYTPDFKLRVARECEAGLKRPAQIIRDHGITDATMKKWHQQYKERGEQAFQSTTHPEAHNLEDQLNSRIKELEGMVGRLAFENDVLKKTWERPGPTGVPFRPRLSTASRARKDRSRSHKIYSRCIYSPHHSDS
jgi:transposase